MLVAEWLQKPAVAIVDAVFAHLPQKQPSLSALNDCKIVSHRGEHDNQTVLENTLPAFDSVLDAGVWGIEFDVRWTKDLVPVVAHDLDCKRVFGSPLQINQVSLKDLKKQLPMIPTLEEVIKAYGGKLHLMVELKEEFYPDPHHQSSVLLDCFAPLNPQSDFHFLSLNPRMFQYVDALPPSSMLPVAELNAARLMEDVLAQDLGGITGPYLLLNQTILKQLKSDMKVGTGFIRSPNCLFRELNRGVEWLFTNDAVAMQHQVDRLISQLQLNSPDL